MKNLIFIAFVSSVVVGLSGCGHHVVYQQTVTADSAVYGIAAQQQGMFSYNQSLVSVNGVRTPVIQQKALNNSFSVANVSGVVVPTQPKAFPLMLVPVSSLNSQGMVVQPTVKGGISIPMVRIPVVTIPMQPMQMTTPIYSSHINNIQQYRVDSLVNNSASSFSLSAEDEIDSTSFQRHDVMQNF